MKAAIAAQPSASNLDTAEAVWEDFVDADPDEGTPSYTSTTNTVRKRAAEEDIFRASRRGYINLVTC